MFSTYYAMAHLFSILVVRDCTSRPQCIVKHGYTFIGHCVIVYF